MAKIGLAGQAAAHLNSQNKTKHDPKTGKFAKGKAVLAFAGPDDYAEHMFTKRHGVNTPIHGPTYNKYYDEYKKNKKKRLLTRN